MKSLSLLLALALTLPAYLHAQKVDCRKDLEKARDPIDERWSFKLFKVGAFDLDGAYDRLEREAKDAKTPAACVDVLDRFMAGLHDGHSGLAYFPGLEWTRPRIEIRSQRDRLSPVPGKPPPVHAYVISRDTTDPSLRQILPGSEILAVDGVSVGDLYSQLESRVSGSTQQWRDYASDRRLLVGPADEEIELTLRQPGGGTDRITIQRPPYLDEEEREHEREIYRDTVTVAAARSLEGGWGYLRFTTFAYKGVDTTVARFDGALDSLLETPGLIIDLRGNGGGYVDAYIEAIARFIDRDMTVGYLQVREPGAQYVIEFWDPKRGGTAMPPLLAEPREPIYTGPVVILVDRGCFSACEGFSGALQAIGRALVVGPEATGGGSGWVGGLRLPSKAEISFSWTVAWLPNGRQIEGHGVTPTIKVRERPVDWAIDRDRVLERAIQALERGELEKLKIADS